MAAAKTGDIIRRDDLMKERERAIKAYNNANTLSSSAIREEIKPLLDKIVDAPAIDCTTVVRCKSCQNAVWSKKENSLYCKRRWAMHKVRERDFCSYGKRKEETQRKSSK